MKLNVRRPLLMSLEKKDRKFLYHNNNYNNKPLELNKSRSNLDEFSSNSRNNSPDIQKQESKSNIEPENMQIQRNDMKNSEYNLKSLINQSKKNIPILNIQNSIKYLIMRKISQVANSENYNVQLIPKKRPIVRNKKNNTNLNNSNKRLKIKRNSNVDYSNTKKY